MADPLDQAAAKLPEMLGQGCLQRYDLEQLREDSGTAFEGAAQLWASQRAGATGLDEKAATDGPLPDGDAGRD